MLHLHGRAKRGGLVSSVTITSIEGNRQRLDGGAMFGNAPRAMWEKWHAPDEQGRIELACRALLLEINGVKVLCETGIGAYLEPKYAERFGVIDSEHKLLASLASVGLTHEDIDYLILSHLHFDHAGGLLPVYDPHQSEPLQLLFPNARYVVGRESFERAKHPHFRDRASFISGMPEALESSRRLIIVDSEKDERVLPEHLSFFYSHGHTPGQMHVVVSSNKKRVVFAGDLIPGSTWVHLPLTMGYDRFAELVIEEKQKLYDRINEDPHDWIIFFTHDPNISGGEIGCDERGRYQLQSSYETFCRWSLSGD